MSLRAWWAVALTALAAVGVAVVVDDSAGALGVAALVFLGTGLLHGARDAPLRGSPAQNVGRVLISGGASIAVPGLVLLALLVLLLTGLCEDLCGDPRTATGLLVAGGLLAGAVVVAVGACWGWRRLDRARSPEHRSPRYVTALPGVVVALVALGAGATDGGDDRPQRPRPTGQIRVLDSGPCVTIGSGDPCVAPRGLRFAAADGTTLALWRTADALRAVVVDPAGRARRIAVAQRLPVPTGAGASADVVARPGGGFVVAWVAAAGERVRFARVDEAGRVRPVRSTAPSPGTAAAGSPATGARPPRPTRAPGPAAPTTAGPATSVGDPATAELALAATPAGFVLFATVRRREDPSEPRRLRAIALDDALRPTGPWRTARTPVPNGLTPAAATRDGGAAVTVGGGVVRTTVTVDREGARPRTARERILVPTARVATAERLPDPRAIPSTRFRPRLLGALRGDGDRLRSLWSTDAAPSEDVPRRTEQQWLLGPGPGTPDRPLAEGLVAAQLLRAGRATVVLALRPRSPDRGAAVDVVLVAAR